MKIRAIPGSGGKARNTLVNASNPPAEAPTATMGNFPSLWARGAARVSLLAGRERVFSFFIAGFAAFVERSTL